MMKPVAFAALMLGVALAAPTSSSPEILLTQKAAADARKTITDMLAAGKDSSACSDLADAILDEVRNAGKEQEKVLATLDDGADCTEQFADAVKAAEDAVTAAESAKTEADSAVTSASSAPVEFSPVNLNTLDTPEGFSCSALASDPAYTAAVSALESAKTAATTAEASLTAAKSTLEATRRQAADAVKICQCHAYATYKEAYDKASSDYSASSMEAWTKGKHMQCVLAGTAPDACEVGSPPALEERTLAPGVDGAHCHGGAAGWINTPGCYVRTPSGCPNQGFDSMGGDASHFDISKGWHHDTWGEANRNAKNSESQCMEVRKSEYDSWCGATDTEMRWVPPEGGYVGQQEGPNTGDLKIEGGGDSGRLMIFVDGKWGTVCDDVFDGSNNGARVACRQMGYADGVHVEDTSHSETQAELPIFIDQNHPCSGSEAKLMDCDRCSGGGGVFGEFCAQPFMSCQHAEDVSVTCNH